MHYTVGTTLHSLTDYDRSLIQRMPGDYWRQFAGMRLLALYQMTHMGAKLNFMGNEIAQFIEWRYYEGIEYFLTKQFPAHQEFQKYIKALNTLYKDQPSLWEKSYDPSGFEWLDADNNEQSVLVFARKGFKPDEETIIILNFDVAAREGFRIPVLVAGRYREVFNSDKAHYGGSGVVNRRYLSSEDIPCAGRSHSLSLRLPPLGGLILRRVLSMPR